VQDLGMEDVSSSSNRVKMGTGRVVHSSHRCPPPGQSLSVLSRAVLPPGPRGMLDFLKIAFLTDISNCFSNCQKNGAYQCNERHPVCVVDRGRAGMCVRGVCMNTHTHTDTGTDTGTDTDIAAATETDTDADARTRR